MQITTEQGVPLVTFLLFFIVSRLFPFVTTQSLNWYGKLFLFFVYSTANFEVAQGGFPSRFCLGFFSQHQTSTTLFWSCGRNRTTPPLPCSLVHFSTSTPKPRAEGRWPSVALCRAGLGSPPRSVLGAPHWGAAPQPAAENKSFCHFQKSQVSLLRCLAFSLVCGMVWQ